MEKYLQDHAWSILPKEFKEEVKKMFEEDKKHPEIHTTCGITTAYHNDMGQRLIDLFGIHNLTSDTEEEEMLTVKRSDVINEFDKLHKLSYKAADLQLGLNAFRTLFGSKCLPDELHEDSFAKSELKPAEPKNEGTHQEQCVPQNAESGTHSFSHILKGGFHDHNRLHIAAMLAQSFVSEMYLAPRDIPRIVTASLGVADALIAAVKEGVSHD